MNGLDSFGALAGHVMKEMREFYGFWIKIARQEDGEPKKTIPLVSLFMDP